jgi:dipeptidyl aminopeptidase/acylaminoacyl peptidase
MNKRIHASRSTGLMWFTLPLILVAAGCGPAATETRTLTEARQGFATHLTQRATVNEPVPPPPPNMFRSVTYASPVGDLAAYVGIDPKDGKKHPAIIWIAGGFDSSIGDFAWAPAFPANDQSGSAFRKAGIVMMYPSFRGGNKNPGCIEGFYGEVDDVQAAADFLAKQSYVDPDRIYLGGHSTGGTLALLVAESSDRFRAVFAFGPVADIRGYGKDNLPFRLSDQKEVAMRSPVRWLHAIRKPTFVFEGTRESNIGQLNILKRASHNSLISFHTLNGANHFSGLAPISRLIAEKILADQEPALNITFNDSELTQALKR